MQTTNQMPTTFGKELRLLPENVIALPRPMTKDELELYWAARIDAITALWEANNAGLVQFPQRSATILPFALVGSAAR